MSNEININDFTSQDWSRLEAMERHPSNIRPNPKSSPVSHKLYPFRHPEIGIINVPGTDARDAWMNAQKEVNRQLRLPSSTTHVGVLKRVPIKIGARMAANDFGHRRIFDEVR